MTTSSPIFHAPAHQIQISRLAAASLGLAVVLLLAVAGGAQVLSAGLRATMAEVYLGVPSWVFAFVGLYQLIAAIMIVWPKTRVSGSMHAGAIALAAIGFNLFGNGTLELIPLNIGSAVAAFSLAWYVRSTQGDIANS